MTDQTIVGGEERARECLAKRYEQAGRFDSAQHIRDGRGADLSLITDAMLTFAAEASGIGVLLSSIDAWMADPSPETEQGIMDARDAFADEGSGIGGGRGPLSRAEKDAVLAYMERHCPHRAKETAWDAVSAFNAIFSASSPDIDRSGLAQEME